MHGRPIPVVLYRTPTGIQGRLQWNDDGRLEPGVEHLDSVLFAAVPRRSGFWGLTCRVERVNLLDSDSLTAEERAQVIPVVLATVESEPDLAEAIGWPYQLLKSGITQRSERLAGGYLHNRLAGSLAVIVIAGLPRLAIAASRQVRDSRRTSRAHRRHAAGACPLCGYDLQRNFGDGCPECGWNLASTSI
jgi:hypothetical protein